MNLSEKQLKEIEELGSLFYTPREIAVIMQLPVKELIMIIKTDADNPITTAFLRGRLLQEAKIRKSVINVAIQGSTPSQTIAFKLISDSKVKLYE